MLSRFLKEAFPHVAGNTVDAVAAELSQALSRPDTAALNDQIATLKAALNDAEDEILRLRQEAISYRLGLKNASKGGLDMLAERARQKSEEGYTDQHDDAHDNGSLISKAIAYLVDVRLREQGAAGFTEAPPDYWPGKPEEWKPKREIWRQKVQAGAILIADLDRQERAGLPHL